MNHTLKTSLPIFILAGLTLSSAVYAQDAAKPADTASTNPAPTNPTTPPAPTVAQAAPALLPAMAGPLAYSAKPLSLDLGPLGSKVYVTGVASGIALAQSNPTPNYKKSLVDISNGQIFIQKVDGQLQYFVQIGVYALPALGFPYNKAGSTAGDSISPNSALGTPYGYLPQAFLKWAPTEALSIQVGKLPTLIGAEYTFSYENLNVERGLLWGQENAVNRGVQVNYAKGPIALSVSWNDAFYSNKFSAVSALLSWTMNSSNTLAFVFGANTKKTSIATNATPPALNNQQIYNLIYTYNAGNILLAPYIQYTHIPSVAALGITASSTFGAALLAKYTVDPHFSVPARVEYIASSGDSITGANPLGYGNGSKAWSLTLTPTYQFNNFFARVEGSIVKATSVAPGLGFGALNDKTSQSRVLIEGGVVF